MKIIIAKIWLHNSQWSKRKEKEMHVICFQDWFEKWNNSELWLLLGIRNIMIILMMMMMMLMILITMIIHHDENEISYNTRLMYVNFFIYTCRLRGDIFEKISKMIRQQQSNFAFWPPDKKITNWKISQNVMIVHPVSWCMTCDVQNLLSAMTLFRTEYH